MKVIFTISLFFTFCSLFAQDVTTDTIFQKKTHIGLTFAPELNYRFVSSDDNLTFIKKSYDTLESPKYGYSIGLNGVFDLTKKLSLTTGLLFSDNGERSKTTLLTQPVNYTNHYYFLSVPAKLNYIIIDSKVDLYGTIGLSCNYFLDHLTTMQVDGEKNLTSFHTKDLTKFSLGGLAGIGMNAYLSKNWYFKTEILYRQSITSVASPIKKWLYSVGPTFGLFYTF